MSGGAGGGCAWGRGLPFAPRTSARPLLLGGQRRGRAAAVPAGVGEETRGAGWKRGREVGFSPAERDFVPPERSRRRPRSVPRLHTLFCLRSGPERSAGRAAIARRAGREPRPAPGAAAPAPPFPPPRRPVSPFAFTVAEVGFSVTFVCRGKKNGGVVVLWSGEGRGVALLPCVRTSPTADEMARGADVGWEVGDTLRGKCRRRLGSAVGARSHSVNHRQCLRLNSARSSCAAALEPPYPPDTGD